MDDYDKNRLKEIKAAADTLARMIDEVATNIVSEYPLGTEKREEVFDNPIRMIAKDILEAAEVDDCGACPLCQC